MKTSSDHLFKLIKSLNGSEKGYFKKYSNFHVRNDQNNYSKLFDAIDLQNEYNEPDLYKKFKHERFMNQFSTAKKYLYDMILESLDAYHTNSNSELRRLLNKIEILTDKGLHVQAQKLLIKAKEMAVSHEMLTYIPEINNMEQYIYRTSYSLRDLKDNSDNLIEETELTSMRIINMAKYEYLKNKLFAQVLEDGLLRNEKEIKNFDWILKDPLLKNDKQALSVNAKILYYDIYTRYYEHVEDFKKCIEVSLKLVKLIEENIPVIENNLNFSSRGLHMMSVQYMYAGKYQKSLEYILRMESLKPRADVQKWNLLFRAYSAKLNIYFTTGNMEKCLQLVAEIEPLLEKSSVGDKLLKQYMYRYIPYLLMIGGEYKQALKWLVKGNMTLVNNTRQDLECIVLIMEIVLHYELGKFDIMESRIKSTFRFLTRKQKLYQIEKITLIFMRKLINVSSKQQSIQFFKQLKRALEPVVNDPLERKFLEHFDIVSWLESKIENKNFEDLVRSKLYRRYK